MLYRFTTRRRLNIASAIIMAMFVALFAFVFHGKLHEEHLHKHIRNTCSDRLSNDISPHLHTSDDFPTQHNDCECQICNLSYLDLFFGSNKKTDLFCDNSAKISFISIINKKNGSIFTTRLLRSPPAII